MLALLSLLVELIDVICCVGAAGVSLVAGLLALWERPWRERGAFRVDFRT